MTSRSPKKNSYAKLLKKQIAIRIKDETKTGTTKAPAKRRERHPMPDFVMEALNKSRLFDAFEERPPYQRNDYVGWISRAKRPETQRARLAQMLDELRRGDVYVKMAHRRRTPAR